MAKKAKETPNTKSIKFVEQAELLKPEAILETFSVLPLNLIEKGGDEFMYNGVNEAAQSVLLNGNVLFATDRVRSKRSDACCGGWLSHDLGSGTFTLINNNRCGCATFEIHFNANITSATVEAISFAFRSNGEQIIGTQMDYTPSAANVYESVSASTLVTVPAGTSKTISVANILGATNLVKNANIIIDKK